jgi:hypothetical protein
MPSAVDSTYPSGRQVLGALSVGVLDGVVFHTGGALQVPMIHSAIYQRNASTHLFHLVSVLGKMPIVLHYFTEDGPSGAERGVCCLAGDLLPNHAEVGIVGHERGKQPSMLINCRYALYEVNMWY